MSKRSELSRIQKEIDGEQMKAASMLRDIGRRLNTGELQFPDAATIIHLGFNGAIKMMEISMNECGYDIKIHCCGKVATAMEENKIASQKRVGFKSKAKGHA